MENTPARTKEVIDVEYTNQAAQAGHKTVLVKDHEKAVEQLQDEILAHLFKMKELREESKNLSIPPPADTL